jgi:hypothetical protein
MLLHYVQISGDDSIAAAVSLDIGDRVYKFRPISPIFRLKPLRQLECVVFEHWMSAMNRSRRIYVT